MALDLGIDVSVDLHNVGPAIVVVVEKSATPSHVPVIDSNAGGERDIGESSVSVVVIEIAGVVGKVRLEDVEPAIAVVVGDSDSHARLLVAIVAVSAPRRHRSLGKGPVVIVMELFFFKQKTAY